MKKKILAIIAVIVLLLVGALYWFKSQPNYRDDKKRISLQVDSEFSYKSIYVSEQGFGNDMANVCRFTLKNPKDIKGFVSVDKLNKKEKEDIDNFYNTDFNTEWEDNKNTGKYTHVINELSALKSSSDTKYIHHRIENSSSYELYIYNKKMNVGYYVVSII